MSDLTFKQFQSAARPVRPIPDNALFRALALGGEVGELLNARKKIERDEPDRGAGSLGPIPQLDLDLLEEAGDVLFYLNLTLQERGFTLEQAAEGLVEKLDTQRREKETTP